jgi:hypothetical protein
MAGGADGPAVSLAVSDELGPIESLEIGRSLFVRATGLSEGAAVRFVLRDEEGRPMAEAAALADGSGQTEELEVWRHSGIVGCDCESGLGAYEFARIEDALYSLSGRVLSIAVVDQEAVDQEDNTLAATPLALVLPARPVAFAADGTGCPRFSRPSGEDLFLAVFGGSAESACEALVFPLPTAGNPPFGGQPFGDPIAWQGGGPSPQLLLLLQAGDRTPAEVCIWFRCSEPGINSGLVIEDHGCPPPPPEPPMQ